MQPLRNELYIKPFPPKEITDGGLVVPDSVKQRPSKALVIATGMGTKQNPMILKPGDIVFHVLGAGSQFDIDGEILWLVRSTDCLAYIPTQQVDLKDMRESMLDMLEDWNKGQVACVNEILNKKYSN